MYKLTQKKKKTTPKWLEGRKKKKAKSNFKIRQRKPKEHKHRG